MLKTAKITAGQRSRIDRYKHLKIKNIITEMIEWIIDNEVYGEPYIAWISVEQIIWGMGMHWKEERCPKRLQVGIREHLKIRKASQLERKRWKKNTGWEVPPFPAELYRTIKNTVKDSIINEIIKENSHTNVMPFWAQGYIDSTTNPPSFNSQYANDVVGWFFFFGEPDVYEFITQWLNSLEGKNKAIRYQFHYNKKMFDSMIRKQIAAAISKLELLDQIQERFIEHKKITPYVNPEHITWDDEEE